MKINKLTTKGIELKEHNGMPKINLYKKGNYTIGSMKVKGINIHISESKFRRITGLEPRKYIMSLRQDGRGDLDNKFKMTQIDLTEEELVMLRNSIDSLLAYRV